jgi:hypothetical protein
MNRATLVLFTCLITLSGCATPVYREVFQEKASYNSKEFNVPAKVLYQATTRAICSKNFIIEKEEADKGFILAKRSFQRGKRSIVLVLQAKMDFSSNDNTMLYLTALQTTEVNYVSDHTRFFLFLVPLPGGGGKSASQVTEGEKVIEDKKFYQDFFNEIEREVSIVSANAVKEKSLKTAQLVEKPQVVSAPQIQETVTQSAEVALQGASSQGKEEHVSSEPEAK